MAADADSSPPFLLDADNERILALKGQQAEDRLGARDFLRLLRKRIGFFWLWGLWSGMLLTLPLLAECRTWQQLRLHGVRTQARVVDHPIHHTRNGKPCWYLAYEYEAITDTGPRAYRREISSSEEQCDRHPLGTRIPVRYSAADPDVVRIDDGSLGPPYFWLTLAGCWDLGVLAGLVWTVRRARRDWRLLRDGELLPGQMLEFHYTGVSQRGAVQACIRYHFVDPEEHGHFGRAWGWVEPDWMLRPLPPAGTPLAVLYLDEQNHIVL